MPGARRKKRGKGKKASAELGGKTSGKFGGGPDNYDGRANTAAGTPKPTKLDVEGPGKVIKTG